MIKSLFAVSLETIINRLIALDPQTKKRLQAFAGNVVRIEIIAAKSLQNTLAINFLLTEQDVQLLPDFAGVPDATIRGTLSALLQQLRDTSPAEIIVEGNMELGQQLREILRSVDIDWEEQMAKVMGDTAAHQMGHAIHKFTQWNKQTLVNLQQDITAYLQEEANYLPTRAEVETFIANVHEIKHAAARLEARWQSYIATS